MTYIMKKKLLFSALLLFLGVSMHAQSVADETMDERFYGKEMPYGWFAEGWKVDDGKVKAQATEESSGFNFNEENADVNGDGQIDIADIVAYNRKKKLLDD